MISRAHDAWDGEASTANQETEGRTAGTRRALLGAAGSFALATSGLLLPNWLEEAAARYGALGGAKGGRRGRNHRGRHRRRTHGDQKDKQKNRRPHLGSSDPTKNIAFIIHNVRPVAVQVQGWDMTQARDGYFMPDQWDWTTLAALPAAGPSLPSTKEFFGSSIQVAIRIGTNRIIYALNHGTAPFKNGELPDVEIGTGGWSSKGWDPRGVLRTQSDPLDYGRSITADGIKITRLDDSSSHLRFSVDLS